MKRILAIVLIFVLGNEAVFDHSIWLQIEAINMIFQHLGLEPPAITHFTKEQLENPTPQLVLTELLNLNKQLKALKLLSKIPKRRLDKKVVRVLRRVLMEIQPSFLNLQLEEEVLKNQLRLSEDDINMFNYIYDETNQILIELNCLYNRNFV